MAGHHLSPPSKKRVPTIRLINIPPQRSAQRSPPINNRRARRENRLATGCSPSLSLPRGARAGDRPTDRPAASHGQARARQVPRRGGVLPAGGSGRRQVPVHDGESAAAVGLHPQGVRDRVPAAAADGGRRRDGEPGARHRGLLPLPHHGRHVRHHRRHRRPHPRDDPDDHLPEAAPGEPRAPGALHRLHQLRRGAELPDGERASDTGGGGDHDGGGAGAHLLHLLGGEEGLRVRVPGAVPGVRLPHPHALLPPADHLPAGQDGDHGVRLHRRARLLRLHHLRHRQPHQGLLLRRVRRRRHRALPRHHQPLPGHPSGARRRRLIGSYI
uniref:Uncharacterized protein n=1 Tax=Zea mays TaxID=4577 RepID=A0A804M5H5_MAIZE